MKEGVEGDIDGRSCLVVSVSVWGGGGNSVVYL